MRSVVRFAVAALAGAVVMGVAPAAHAAGALSGATWVATPNGVVGVQETVVLKAPRLKGQVATLTLTAPDGTSTSGQTVVNSVGFASLPWTPSQAGTWTVTAAGTAAAAGSTTVAVAAMPTSTQLLVAGELASGVATTIVVNVSSLAGSIAPSGTVTVTDQYGHVVASGALTPGSAVGQSVANLLYTPSAAGVVLTATFAPSTGAFSASTSTTQAPAVGSGQTVSIRMPTTLYVGQAAQLDAVTAAGTPDGSAAFSLNIDGFTFYPMGGSFPVNSVWGATNGVGSTMWTPTQTGVQTVNVSFSTGNFAINGRDNQVVNVQPAPTADVPTVVPAGSGAWPPGPVGSLPAGSGLQLSAASTSGSPVTLSTDGPCTINGDTLTVLSAGTCTVTASTLGTNGSLVPSSSNYVITITAAKKK
ncbi:MAG: hypothetical protein GC156_03105 [Actinomycetales bacterium]|nr:hypothetical protein [Actinomycetales bacterium]